MGRYIYFLLGWKVYRRFGQQKPMDKKMYRRMAVTAPQILRRSIHRHEGFIRCMQLCFGNLRKLDTFLHRSKAEISILGAIAAMHADHLLVSVSFFMIGMNIHAGTLLEC